MSVLQALGGLGMSIAGTALTGHAGDIARNRLISAADMPGVDVDAVTRAAIAGNLASLPQAADLTGRIDKLNRERLAQLIESSVPGYSARLAKEADIIDSYLRGEIPADVEGAISRSVAARALGGGYAAPGARGMQSNLLARNLGLTSLGLQQTGMGAIPQFMSQIKLAPLTNLQSYLGLDPLQRVNLASRERDIKQSLYAQAAGIPGGTAAWGSWLQQTGGAMLGAGLGGMSPGSSSAGLSDIPGYPYSAPYLRPSSWGGFGSRSKAEAAAFSAAQDYYD